MTKQLLLCNPPMGECGNHTFILVSEINKEGEWVVNPLCTSCGESLTDLTEFTEATCKHKEVESDD